MPWKSLPALDTADIVDWASSNYRFCQETDRLATQPNQCGHSCTELIGKCQPTNPTNAAVDARS